VGRALSRVRARALLQGFQPILLPLFTEVPTAAFIKIDPWPQEISPE
jgi:hypothetical protein